MPAFVYITPANIHDSKAKPEISYESGEHYIFNRVYNNFSNLNTINHIEPSSLYGPKTMCLLCPKPGNEDCRKVSFLCNRILYGL